MFQHLGERRREHQTAPHCTDLISMTGVAKSHAEPVPLLDSFFYYLLSTLAFSAYMFAFIDYVDWQFYVVASESVLFHKQLKPVEAKKQKKTRKT